VQRKEIPAYRPDPSGTWRVYTSDVFAFLTRTTNLEFTRPKRVLRKGCDKRTSG
jgi:hypothetical protein